MVESGELVILGSVRFSFQVRSAVVTLVGVTVKSVGASGAEICMKTYQKVEI
jgi:hypothetical protein